MDTKEVIVDQIIHDTSANDKSHAEVLKINENDGVQNITETFLLPQKINTPNSVIRTTETMNDCKVVLLNENNESKLSCNTETNTHNQPQEVIDPLNTSHSMIHIQNKNYSSSEDSNINKDVLDQKIKQTENDIYIMYENNLTVPVKTSDKVSSLVSIAVEYNSSDSETDVTTCAHEDNQNIPLKKIQMQVYRQNKEVLSENSEDEDDWTSNSSSTASIESDESDESDSDNNTNTKEEKNNTKVQKNTDIKSELDDLPPIEELKINVPEVLCDPLGEVAWTVEQLVVVKPKPGKPTLNLDTVLFVEKGQRALGKIFDVFGQVSEPHYCVRFNSFEHIQKCHIKVGMTVYYCPNTEYTSLVFLHEIMKIKGIDANADEPPEFSDDEEERAYYEKLKEKQTHNINETGIPIKRKRTLISDSTTDWHSNHPWNRNMPKSGKRYQRGEYNSFSFTQSGYQSQSSWPHSYQNSWSQNLHSENNGEYGYATSSLQSVQFLHHNVNSINQNFYNSHNYYNGNNTVLPLNPRIPFNVPPRIPSGYLSFQNHSNSSQNVRFQTSNMSWQAQLPQFPMRMRIPWVPLPPPPPPPPPPSTTASDTN